MQSCMRQITFCTSKRTLNLEADFDTINSIEQIATLLGAIRDEESHNRFFFSCKLDEQNEKSLVALEKIWYHLQSIPFFRIKLKHRNQTILIEGGADDLRTISALVQAFNKEILDDGTVIFDDDEQYKFDALHSASMAMGLLPYC